MSHGRKMLLTAKAGVAPFTDRQLILMSGAYSSTVLYVPIHPPDRENTQRDVYFGINADPTTKLIDPSDSSILERGVVNATLSTNGNDDERDLDLVDLKCNVRVHKAGATSAVNTVEEIGVVTILFPSSGLWSIACAPWDQSAGAEATRYRRWKIFFEQITVP